MIPDKIDELCSLDNKYSFIVLPKGDTFTFRVRY